jgi:hypothetical protein
MEVTVDEVVNSATRFSELNQISMPIGLSLKMVKNQKLVTEVLDQYSTKEKAVLAEYGEETESTGTYSIPKDKLSVVNDKLTEIRAEVIELDLFPIRVSDLGDEANLSPATILALDWFFLPEPD